MADSDKNILITPRTDSSETPSIDFTGDNDSPMKMQIFDSGDLVFTGSSGTLFTISNDVSDALFQVNDVSGISLVDVNDSGAIRMAPNLSGGHLLIGYGQLSTLHSIANQSDRFQVNGSIYVDGDIKTATGVTIKPLGSALANNATGNPGDIKVDADYIYVCTATDTWKRAALQAW
jgi:hypothetical protein